MCFSIIDTEGQKLRLLLFLIVIECTFKKEWAMKVKCFFKLCF